MIDDIKQIHERDKEDVLGAIENEWQQLQANVICSPALEAGTIKNVVYAAMGGSAMAAVMANAISICAVPLEVVRDYDIPQYVDEQTLFIACSSSGNTEETIEAITRAAERGAQIVVITAGGKLREIAEQKGYPLVLVPKLRNARFTVFYTFNALATVLAEAKVATTMDFTPAVAFLRQELEAWSPTVAAKDNIAKQLAQECMGRSVVIYSGTKLAPAAYRWKMAMNESAKQVAWTGILPEFNHNEFAGWSGQPEQKPYAVIELRSALDHPRVQKRFETTERLLSGMRPSPIVVQVKGKTALEQLLWATMIGDFVGAYQAILNGYDPASLAIVDKFKQAMGEYTASTA